MDNIYQSYKDAVVRAKTDRFAVHVIATKGQRLTHPELFEKTLNMALDRFYKSSNRMDKLGGMYVNELKESEGDFS